MARAINEGEGGIFRALRAVVRRIPAGSVMTYGGVAEAAGLPGYSRQVAWALRNAPPGLPWHRVLGAGGKIRLPGQSGAEQRLRLEAEGVRFVNGKTASAAAIKQTGSKKKT